MVFDESGDLKNIVMKDDDDLLELFKLWNNEFNRPEVEVNLEFDVVDRSLTKKVKENN